MNTQPQQLDPLNDGISELALLHHMGDDLTPVNSARVSYAGTSDELTDADIKLMAFLARHQHTSPFRHAAMTFRVKAPLAIARQWWKHVIASCHVEEQNGWNEQSLRYVEVKDEFYTPSAWRQQAENNRQASEGILDAEEGLQAYSDACRYSFKVYQDLLHQGVCREQARLVLPASTYTSWYWTASLQSVLHFVNLRNKKDAQGEMVEFAKGVEALACDHFPNVFAMWRDV